MGVAFSCNPCPTAASSSVVNLSDTLVKRMVEGIEEPPVKGHPISVEEKDWIEKIHCLDEVHSNAYHLTMKAMEDLMLKVETRMREGTVPKYCSPDVVKGCYKYNSNCTLNCAKEVTEFIDCLDATRLQRLHAFMETTRKQQQLLRKAEKAKRAKSR